VKNAYGWTVNDEVASMEKNEVESIRIQTKTHSGQQYVDLRVWYVDEYGEYHPSRKGFTFPATTAKVERFAEAIEALLYHVRGQAGHA